MSISSWYNIRRSRDEDGWHVTTQSAATSRRRLLRRLTNAYNRAYFGRESPTGNSRRQAATSAENIYSRWVRCNSPVFEDSVSDRVSWRPRPFVALLTLITRGADGHNRLSTPITVVLRHFSLMWFAKHLLYRRPGTRSIHGAVIAATVPETVAAMITPCIFIIII